MSMSERLSHSRRSWGGGTPRTRIKLERAAGNNAEMRRAGLATLLPLPCLLVIALLAQAWNYRHHLTAPPMPGVSAAPISFISKDQDTVQLRQELKTVLLRYRTLKGAEREQATYAPAWKRWQSTMDGVVVGRRMARLRSWKDFSVQSVEERDSGFYTALVNCDEEYLKVWLIPGPDGWRVAGLVRPFN